MDGMSASAAFCDFDRDGFLDLYVTRYVDYLPAKRCSGHDGRPDFCGPQAFRPVHDIVLHNEGAGADGSVRFLPYTIDQVIFQALTSRHGRDAVSSC